MSSERSKECSIKEIVEYWEKSCYEDKTEKLPIFLDLGEPTCFACGESFHAKFDGRRGFAGWKDAPLERAHIMPRALGGSDNDPSNRVMLCESCHPQNPHTNDRDVYMMWLHSVKPARGSFIKDMQMIWLSDKEYLKKAANIWTDPFELIIFYEWRSKFTSFHFSNKWVSWKDSMQQIFPDLVVYIKWVEENGNYKPDITAEIEEKINKYIDFESTGCKVLDYDPRDKFNWPKAKPVKKKRASTKKNSTTTSTTIDSPKALESKTQQAFDKAVEDSSLAHK